MNQSIITTTSSPINRVPKVTVEFWLIKLLAVTMGETAADYLAVNLGLGLSATSLIMVGVLVVALFGLGLIQGATGDDSVRNMPGYLPHDAQFDSVQVLNPLHTAP